MNEILRAATVELEGLMGAPVAIEDHRFDPVAVSDQWSRTWISPVKTDPHRHRPHRQPIPLGHDEVTSVRVESASGAVTTHWCLPLRRGGTVHGYVWTTSQSATRPPICEATRAVCRSITDALIDRWLRRDAPGRALARLLHASEPETESARVEQLCGWDARQLVRVVMVRNVPGFSLSCGIRADVVGEATVVVPVQGSDRSRDELAGRVRAGASRGATESWAAGIGSQTTLTDITTSWRHARAALRVAATSPAPQRVRWWDDLGVRRLISLDQTDRLAEAAIPASAHALLQHHDPTLVRTARTFLDLAGRVKPCADVLAIHRQTLYRRLERIERITGLDLACGRDRLELHLALTIADDLLDRHDPNPRK